ncbi:MAG TPA: carboxypeptidase-like regulatory domain-containing protein, partial [Hanamia sp.]|nr:carboxypeptidase-like regulatory domain-containing protein [Hanamia sp.]
KDLADAMLQAAGKSLYKKATLYNWSAVRSLADTGNIFIAEHLDALTANGNMPAGFQTTFATAGERCMSLSESFLHIKMDKEAATQKKIDANSAIYRSVIEMLKDGQQIFRNDPAAKRQFIFNHLVSMQRGEGSASLKGCIVDSLNQPVEGVLLQSQDQKYTDITDSNGNYRIGRIAAGTHTFLIAGAGFHSIWHTITLAAGPGNKADFTLEKQMQRVA